MKIVYLISGRSFHSDSLGRKISEVIDVMSKNGNTVDIICGGDIENKNDMPIEYNYGNSNHFQKKYRNQKYLKPIINSLSEIKDIIHDKKLFNFLEENKRKNEIGLIWERSSRLHPAGYQFAKKNNIPYVMEWLDHLIDYKFSLFKSVALKVERNREKKSDYIVVVSEVLKREIENSGIKGNKIKIAYNGVNPSEFKPNKEIGNNYRKEIDVNEKDIVIGYLGSYAFYHDTERIIYAAKILKEKGITYIKFLLVGNGKDYNKCHDLAVKLGVLGNNLIMKEGVPKEKVPEILSAIDISVLPGSTDIICPIKVFEYMAAETVAVIPDYECNREIINHNTNGILFKPFDEEDLAKKIIALVESPELMNRIAKTARAEVIEKYTWEKTWGKVLKEIIGQIKND